MSGYLLDTHLLLWAATGSERLPGPTRALLEDPTTEIRFSVVNLWEIVIKSQVRPMEFQIDADALRAYARLAGLAELALLGEHVLRVGDLPLLHRDPFDRLLLAQARYEKLTLLTADAQLLAYGEGVEQG